MVKLGLVGRTLGHSFSRGYFTEKFAELDLGATFRYDNYELPDVGELPAVLHADPGILGLNVTIPYKRAVVRYLDELHGAAAELQTVNTIVRHRDGRLHGHNTDVVGFRTTVDSFGESLPRGATAIVLGTGGASAAVAYVLAELGIGFQRVSRAPGPGELGYAELAGAGLDDPRVWVNTTPLGTAPDADRLPDVPLACIGEGHVVIDLIYNPSETRLLREARLRGAGTANGLAMLHGQAEASWRLWQAELAARA